LIWQIILGGRGRLASAEDHVINNTLVLFRNIGPTHEKIQKIWKNGQEFLGTLCKAAGHKKVNAKKEILINIHF
jgi:hypothetical protein